MASEHSTKTNAGSRGGSGGAGGGMLSIRCQTEWSWLASMKRKQREFDAGSDQSDEGNDDRSQSESGSSDDAILAASPYPSRRDEYGIIIDGDEASESSDEEEEVVYTSEEESGSCSSASAGSNIDDEEKAQKAAKALRLVMEGLFEGACDFCGQDKKPFPSLDDQASFPPADLYCCNEYREYVDEILLANSRTARDRRANRADKRRTVKKVKLKRNRQNSESVEEGGNELSEAEDGKKSAEGVRRRRRARGIEGAGDKGGEIIIEGDEEEGGGVRRTRRRDRMNRRWDLVTKEADYSDVSFAREMTTINYQLSSRACLEQGWTVRPSANQDADLLTSLERDPTADPANLFRLPGVESEARGKLVIKTYDNGKPFLVVFPDGSGNIFYPSGAVAATVLADQPGGAGRTYVLQGDKPRVHGGTPPSILSVLQQGGLSFVHHPNGMNRVCLSPQGGMEADEQGTKRRKWLWSNSIGHSLSPPLQQITRDLSSLHAQAQPMAHDLSSSRSQAQRMACQQHVHAPPLYPITCRLSAALSVQVTSCDDVTVEFSRRERACHFSVGGASSVQGGVSKSVRASGREGSDAVADVFDLNEAVRARINSRITEILQQVSALIRHPSTIGGLSVRLDQRFDSLLDPNPAENLASSAFVGSRKRFSLVQQVWISHGAYSSGPAIMVESGDSRAESRAAIRAQSGDSRAQSGGAIRVQLGNSRVQSGGAIRVQSGYSGVQSPGATGIQSRESRSPSRLPSGHISAALAADNEAQNGANTSMVLADALLARSDVSSRIETEGNVLHDNEALAGKAAEIYVQNGPIPAIGLPLSNTAHLEHTGEEKKKMRNGADRTQLCDLASLQTAATNLVDVKTGAHLSFSMNSEGTSRVRHRESLILVKRGVRPSVVATQPSAGLNPVLPNDPKRRDGSRFPNVTSFTLIDTAEETQSRNLHGAEISEIVRGRGTKAAGSGTKSISSVQAFSGAKESKSWDKAQSRKLMG